MSAKRNIFTALGWLVWKIAALLGSRWARGKLDEHQESTRYSHGLRARLRRRR